MSKNEPDFVVQATDPDIQKRSAWIREKAALAKSIGCVWTRVTSKENDPATVLIEGWKQRPADESEPRFKRPSAKDVTP